MRKIFISALLTFSVLVHVQGQKTAAHKAVVKGGVAQVNITPPVGCRLAGHFYESISTGIHDSLWAKAMVLEQAGQKFALVFCDLIGLTPAVSTPARQRASSLTGIPFSHILVAATHSHTGPLYYGFQHDYFHGKALAKGVDPHEETDYTGFLTGQIVKAIVQGNKNLHAVRLESGTGLAEGISFNRRYYMKNGEALFNPGPLNPDIVGPAGPVDPEVGILMLRDAVSRKLFSGLTVFAVHADSFGGTEISADYPYYLEQTLQAQFGENFVSLYGLGPCGDVNHIDVRKDAPIYDPSNPLRLGTKLGQTVVNQTPHLRKVTTPSLTMLSAKLLLPMQVPTGQQIDSAKVLINGLYEAHETGDYVKRAGGEAGDFLKRVEMSKYIQLEKRKPTTEVEVQVFRVDDQTAIVGLPGEIFSELGLAIKKASPFKNTIVLTVCNDKTSYIPTRKAFAEGSYEVTIAVVKPGSGEMLVDTALRLLTQLKGLPQ